LFTKMQSKLTKADKSNAQSVWLDREKVNKLRSSGSQSSEEDYSVRSDPEVYTQKEEVTIPKNPVGDIKVTGFADVPSSQFKQHRQFGKEKVGGKPSDRRDADNSKPRPGPIVVDNFVFEQKYVNRDGITATLRKQIWERESPDVARVPVGGANQNFVSQFFREIDAAKIQYVFDKTKPDVREAEVNEGVVFIDPFAKGSD